jgi:hypothetical protein
LAGDDVPELCLFAIDSARDFDGRSRLVAVGDLEVVHGIFRAVVVLDNGCPELGLHELPGPLLLKSKRRHESVLANGAETSATGQGNVASPQLGF